MTSEVLYALPGWGFSSEIFKLLSIKNLTIVGLDYIDAPLIKLESITNYTSKSIPDHSVIIAWSFGGLIAIQLASLFPEKVRKLILISSQPRFLSHLDWIGINPSEADSFIKSFNDDPKMHIGRFISLVNYPHFCLDRKAYLLKIFFSHKIKELSLLLNIFFQADLREVYKNLNHDVLHIINKNDAVIKQNENQLKTLKPNIKIINIDKSGHSGFLNCSNQYQHVIRSFYFDDL